MGIRRRAVNSISVHLMLRSTVAGPSRRRYAPPQDEATVRLEARALAGWPAPGSSPGLAGHGALLLGRSAERDAFPGGDFAGRNQRILDEKRGFQRPACLFRTHERGRTSP